MSKNKSSLNLFLILPIFICFTMGCICSGSPDYRSCVTADGETLVLGESDLYFIKYADGRIAQSDSKEYSGVLCGGDNNEIVAIDERYSDGKRGYYQRTAYWQTSPKNHKFADDEFFEKYTGFLQNRYFVSSSRGYITKSRNEGTGKNRRSVNYRVYTQPQVFTVEDAVEGKVKSHHVTREKLGLAESVYYDDLRFYPLGLSNEGVQIFAVINNSERSISVYRLDVFSGTLRQIFGKNHLPGNEFCENPVFDKSGRFLVCNFWKLDQKNSMVKSFSVLNLEKGEVAINRDFPEISSMDGIPQFIFDQNSGKLGVLAAGFSFKHEPQTKRVKKLIVYDLESRREIADINLEEKFENPDKVQLIYFRDDDFILTRARKQERRINGSKYYVSRFNFRAGQIIWDTELQK